MDSLECFQFGKQKKWGEIVSALKLKSEGNNTNLSAQLKSSMNIFLYEFEKFPASKVAIDNTKG